MVILSRSAVLLRSAVRPGVATTSKSVTACAALHTSSVRAGPWDGPLQGGNRYLVVVKDYRNRSALARRLEVREEHMEDVRKGVEVGRIELAGGLLSKDFSDIDETTSPVLSLCGSAFIVQGSSVEEVRSRVLNDEYAQTHAWDASTVKIYPFLPAFIKPSTPVSSTTEQAEVIARRTPYGVSPRRAKTIARNEVFVTDPRSTGAALNNVDRQAIGSSLSALRRGSAGLSQPRKVTLDNLRKHSVPPVYGEGA